jgi:hypothetical protein
MTSESTTPTNTESAEKESLRKLRVEFWTKRLDHTLTHTESASRLIYVVDGAVLALLAFIAEKLRPSGPEELFVAIPVAFLALLNYYHAEIIMRQREWYNAIDQRIRETLDNERTIDFKSDSTLGGTHHIYSRIHRAIAWFLLVAALAIGVHGFVGR